MPELASAVITISDPATTALQSQIDIWEAKFKDAPVSLKSELESASVLQRGGLYLGLLTVQIACFIGYNLVFNIVAMGSWTEYVYHPFVIGFFIFISVCTFISNFICKTSDIYNAHKGLVKYQYNGRKPTCLEQLKGFVMNSKAEQYANILTAGLEEMQIFFDEKPITEEEERIAEETGTNHLLCLDSNDENYCGEAFYPILLLTRQRYLEATGKVLPIIAADDFNSYMSKHALFDGLNGSNLNHRLVVLTTARINRPTYENVIILNCYPRESWYTRIRNDFSLGIKPGAHTTGLALLSALRITTTKIFPGAIVWATGVRAIMGILGADSEPPIIRAMWLGFSIFVSGFGKTWINNELKGYDTDREVRKLVLRFLYRQWPNIDWKRSSIVALINTPVGLYYLFNSFLFLGDGIDTSLKQIFGTFKVKFNLPSLAKQSIDFGGMFANSLMVYATSYLSMLRVWTAKETPNEKKQRLEKRKKANTKAGEHPIFSAVFLGTSVVDSAVFGDNAFYILLKTLETLKIPFKIFKYTSAGVTGFCIFLTGLGWCIYKGTDKIDPIYQSIVKLPTLFGYSSVKAKDDKEEEKNLDLEAGRPLLTKSDDRAQDSRTYSFIPTNAQKCGRARNPDPVDSFGLNSWAGFTAVY